MLAVLYAEVSAFSMVPEPIVPTPPVASNSMNWALPLAIIAKASFAPPGIFRVITPRLSAPIAYVPVNACAASAAPGPTPLVSSSPLVILPDPSAVNLHTSTKKDATTKFHVHLLDYNHKL